MSTPRQLGYRMPPEWAPHAGTWLSWPRHGCVSFRGWRNEVLPAFGELAAAVAPHEPVHISVGDDALEAEARTILGPVDNVHFHRIPTNEPWCRDHGPTFVKRETEVAIVDWDYNAYGGKFRPFDLDDAVPERVAGIFGIRRFRPGIVLEGGSFDVNGTGAVLVTEACLLHPNRNPHLTRADIEQYLRDYLGVNDVLWLGQGLLGDDTDGHVDDLSRFVNTTTVVTAVEPDPHDPNYAPLQENLRRLKTMKQIERIIELPMPGAIEHNGQRLPASYANFYIANGVVIIPAFEDPNDARAAAILQDLFPTRQVIGLDSRTVVRGGGSFHCLTQQQPISGT